MSQCCEPLQQKSKSHDANKEVGEQGLAHEHGFGRRPEGWDEVPEEAERGAGEDQRMIRSHDVN